MSISIKTKSIDAVGDSSPLLFLRTGRRDPIAGMDETIVVLWREGDVIAKVVEDSNAYSTVPADPGQFAYCLVYLVSIFAMSAMAAST